MKKKIIDFDLITTKDGDKGETSLFDGSRKRKDDIIFDALGDIDELNSWLGVIRSHIVDKKSVGFIERVQGDMFKIGAMIATPYNSKEWGAIRRILSSDVLALERIESIVLKKTDIEFKFVAPGNSKESSFIDVARTVCRRAERKIISCIRDRNMIQLCECQKYLNRLSDYLFILARYVDQKQNFKGKKSGSRATKNN